MAVLRTLLGEALRTTRLRQERTLREVSSAAQVSLGYLSEVERGQKEASSELLASICRALGVRLSDVLRDVSESLSALEPEPAPVQVPDTIPADLPALEPVGADGPDGEPAAGRARRPRRRRRCLSERLQQRRARASRVGGEQQPVGDQHAGQQEEQRLLERQAEQQHAGRAGRGDGPDAVGERQPVGGAQPQRDRQRDERPAPRRRARSRSPATARCSASGGPIQSSSRPR